MKNEKAAHYLAIVLFLVVICTPLLFGVLNKSTGAKLDITLKGNYDIYNKPDFRGSDFFSGAFQQDYTAWFDANFKPRGLFIVCYNQFRYSIFSQIFSILGNDGTIFGKDYTLEALVAKPAYDNTLTENKQKLAQYVWDLERLSDKLEESGRHLILYTSLNKSYEMRDALPQKYKLQADPYGERAIDAFRELMAQSPVAWFDSGAYFEKNRVAYPLFYKTSVHWSRPTEQTVNAELLKILRERFGYPIGSISLEKLETSDKPYWRDWDAYNLINIAWGKTDPTYYQYAVSVHQKDALSSPGILLSGGSFSEGFWYGLDDYKLGSRVAYINYETAVYYPDGNKYPIQSWDDVDFATLLDKTDFVVIEINEAHFIRRIGDGLVAYLTDYLDKNSIAKRSVESTKANMPERIEPTSFPQYTKYASGFYGYETNGGWLTTQSSFTIQNTMVSKHGLKVSFKIPTCFDQSQNEYVSISVNGVIVRRVDLSESGDHEVVIEAEEIKSDNDVYTIVLDCQRSFVPKDLNGGNDSRNLSLWLYSIGEDEE